MDIKKVARVRFSTGQDEEPKPLPRSASTTGLSSLSKGLIEHEKNIEEISGMITNMREIIGKYEEEIKQMQCNHDLQECIIKTQATELIKAKWEIEQCVKKIQDIWDS